MSYPSRFRPHAGKRMRLGNFSVGVVPPSKHRLLLLTIVCCCGGASPHGRFGPLQKLYGWLWRGMGGRDADKMSVGVVVWAKKK